MMYLPSPPSSDMAVQETYPTGKKCKAKITTPQQSKKAPKVRVRQVLAQSLQPTWPQLNKAQLCCITDEVNRCSVFMLKPASIQPAWEVLKKIPKENRAKEIASFRQKHLESMSVAQREKLLEQEVSRKEKWSHVFMGYNKIMREIEKGTLAALLVNKTVQPPFLPMTFLPVCSTKKIPVVPVENLDAFYHKTIAIGLKKSVLSPDCCFHSLFKKMVQILDEISPPKVSLANSTTAILHKRSTNKVKKSNKLKAPNVNVNKYLLRRTRDDQVVFIPGAGMNPLSELTDSEFIMIGKDDPLLDYPVDQIAKFDFRKDKTINRSKNYQPKRKHEIDMIGCNDSVSEIKPSPNIMKQPSEALFILDVGEVEEAEPVPSDVSVVEEKPSTSNTLKTLKRARESSSILSYLPANVLRLVGNPGKEKVKKNKKVK